MSGVPSSVIPNEVTPIPIEAPIKSEKDLESYQPPDPDEERRFEQIQRWVKRYKEERAIVAFVTDHNSITSDMLGFSERLIAFYTNPELVLRVHEIVLDYQLRYINNAIEAGADIVFIVGDWAYKNGPMFSMEHYNKFVLPPFKAMVQEAKKGRCLKGSGYPPTNRIEIFSLSSPHPNRIQNST